MENNFMVITEIHENGKMERWYYGTYNRARANEVALELGGEWPVYHCVIPANEAESWGVKNLPRT